MTADDVTPGEASPRDGLAQQLRQLEAFVARAEQEGEELPAEAVEMVARLKEIVQALDSLTSSLGVAERPGQ
jgi:TolA-binding protein